MRLTVICFSSIIISIDCVFSRKKELTVRVKTFNHSLSILTCGEVREEGVVQVERRENWFRNNGRDELWRYGGEGE